jgi:hypothetical protein
MAQNNCDKEKKIQECFQKVFIRENELRIKKWKIMKDKKI